ncbi:MAG: C_GCAxxG_C_C family protein [Paludibacteraceae bacterium]|nr:C_GCAxxG_C_C family protein [Paludibacteraceae bacterium]
MVDVAQRRNKAVDLFKSGFNCAQAVAIAYSDVLGMSDEEAAKVSGSFGGGMGRMGEVCGTLSGAFMVMGHLIPVIDPKDAATKQANYAAVRELADKFKAVFGNIRCADLLQEKKIRHTPSADDPNAEFYAKRPCAFYVAVAAELVGERINAMG